MSRSITITLPHDLGTQEAKRRIAAGFDRLRHDYIDKFAYSDAQWEGDRANLRFVAFGQTVTAQLEVLAESLRIEVHLPWLLAALGSKVQDVLAKNAKESLSLGYQPKKP